VRNVVEPVNEVIKPEPDRRRGGRRAGERRATPIEAQAPPALPVAISAASEALEPADPATVFAAQLLGQPGQKRGLRGGPETLERAREAYLGAQWRGRRDRRGGRGGAADEEA